MKHKLTQYEKQSMWETHNKKCFYCGELLPIKNMHVDHIIPVKVFKNREDEVRKIYKLDDIFSFNSLENFAPSCPDCNSKRKNSKEITNGIPLWVNETIAKKGDIIRLANTLEKELLLTFPDEYKNFILSSDNFILSGLNVDFIRKSDIPLYKKLTFSEDYYPLSMTNPNNIEDEVNNINTLEKFEKYYRKGYYGRTTPEIGLETFLGSYLRFFKLFENSRPNTKQYINYLDKIPIDVLNHAVLCDDVMYNSKRSIAEFAENNKHILLEISKNKIVINDKQNKDTYIITEIVQANFSNNVRNEALLHLYYRSAGTLHFTILFGIFFEDDVPQLLDIDEYHEQFDFEIENQKNSNPGISAIIEKSLVLDND